MTLQPNRRKEKPTAEKADAPKHATGHATDPTLVFKTVHIVRATVGQRRTTG